MNRGAAAEAPSQGGMVSGMGAGRVRLDLATTLAAVRARGPLVPAAALLGVGALLRLGLIARGWPALDSDEAVLGLMARHILYAGERPIFYYGQHYMGALDAYVAAAFFAVLGPTTLALHLSMLPLTIGFLAAMYGVGRAAFGPAVGLLVLACLALGPAFGLLRETATIGGYQDTLFLAAVLPLLVYARLREPDLAPRGRAAWARALGLYALIGLLVGLGIWADELILPFAGAALLALAVGRRREAFGALGLVLVAGLLLGCGPFLADNLHHGWATFAELARQNRPAGQHGLLPPLPHLLDQIGGTLAVGLPAALGSPHVCVAAGGTWPSYPPDLAAVVRAPVAACDAVNVLFAIGFLACLAVAAWQLAGAVRRRWRRRMRPPRDDAGRAARVALDARLWLRVMLLLGGLGTLLLYTLSRTAAIYQFTAARYLLPLYVALPLVFGVLWQAAEPVFERGAARYRYVSQARAELVRGAAAIAGMALLLALAAYGAAATVGLAGDGARFAQPAPAADRRLIATLEARGQTRFVSDYWTCYRLAFESGERLRCAVRDGVDGTLTRNGSVNRYAPYLDLIERTPHPAYLFLAGSAQDATFAAWAASQGLPHTGYARLVAEGYAVYYYPG